MSQKTGFSQDEKLSTLEFIPVCQAKGCASEATETIESRHGHPDREWKLCRPHYSETGGEDPFNLPNKDWILCKLMYRCYSCGGISSHNSILPENLCPKCGYSQEDEY